MSDGVKRGDERFALIAERLLHEATGMSYDTFREQARKKGAQPPAFDRLVVSAYVDCRETENRVKEMADQVERTLKGYRASVDMHNDPNAAPIINAMAQLATESADLEARVEMFKLILNQYVQQQADSKESK